MKKEELIEKATSIETPKYLRIAYVFELMNIADSQCLDALSHIAKQDPCELVRHEAVFAIGETASLDSIDILKELIKTDSSQVVQHEALVALGTIGTKQDLEFIEPYTQNEEFEISCSAKIARDRIIQIDDFENDVSKHREYYEKKLFDYSTSQNFRIQVLFQLMRIADERAIKNIGKCLKEDICRIVKHEAGFVLGEIGTPLAIEELKESLNQETIPIVVHENLFALGTTGKKEALSIIEEYLEHENSIIGESAKIAKDRILYLENPYSGAKHFA